MDLKTLKDEYLKIDTDQDDALLKTLITAAKEYIKNGIGRYVEGNAQFELVVGMLVEHWYENRGMYESGVSGSNIPFTVHALLTQLRYVDVKGNEEDKQIEPKVNLPSKEKGAG
ncbi:head-tail connector protein [Bacillus sp. FSL L8-0167]|uniref:head-tail connector protein n=1 Tax=Bacillus TaxID=1386 RepID=UPI00061B28AF|nr:head-tail connector protein [Bacillus safensis]KKD42558.1 DNA-packaging protein [Bacillus safensis]MCM3448843.1 head-tail connector protein [Bacillus safensis]MDR6681600.1 putative phage protein (predicted DNA packaging) [Bacillus safensis]MEC0949764.1 head-tail connector protein [Bacillus safensis]MED5092644.1 head-tail connector protein [Bacillus safensis]